MSLSRRAAFDPELLNSRSQHCGTFAFHELRFPSLPLGERTHLPGPRRVPIATASR